MAISLTKDLPSSDWYSGTGSTTITLAGATEIQINTKKELIKIKVPQSQATQDSNPSDKGKIYVKDLKNVDDTIRIRGWIEDDSTDSAWNKAWKLRGMCASGGPLDNLTIENVVFDSSTQQAFLEEVTFIAHPLTSKGLRINETASDGIARIEVDLNFFIGDKR